MKMRNRLARSAAVVENEAVARVEFFFLGDGSGCEEKVAQEIAVFGPSRVHTRDGFEGNDENVRGRLRVDIADGDAEVVFVNDLRGDFAFDDFGKKGVSHDTNSSDAKREAQSEKSLDNQQHAAVAGLKLAETGADEGENFVVEPLAGTAPELGADDGFDTGTEADEANEGRMFLLDLAYERTEAVEEGQFEAAPTFESQLMEVGFDDMTCGGGRKRWIGGRVGRRRKDLRMGFAGFREAFDSCAEDPVEFAASDPVAVKFDAEIMEDGTGDLFGHPRFDGSGTFVFDNAGGEFFESQRFGAAVVKAHENDVASRFDHGDLLGLGFIVYQSIVEFR